jgi:D-cysteine desulfhydrase family pyridoxal phosphate-dependent enzyme
MIPRIRFATLPTPIEALPRLSAALKGPRLLVKRDDLTGLAFGGNKTRKLEYVIAEALAVGAKTLITVGAAQSNHCRQTAALSARMGLDCILVLSGDEPDQPSGNLLIDHILGAQIVWTTRAERNNTLNATFNQVWEEGRRPYMIPLGASTALGAAAFAGAFDEMLVQTANERIDWVVVASSSGGTQAGLALGALRRSFTGRVLGISIDEPEHDLRELVAFLANEAADRLGEKVRIKPEQVFVNADYLGAGYGVLGAAEKDAIDLFARHEGLLLDPVYTGRAAAGMIDLIRKGFFSADETILFWHTGGTPALFASSYESQLAAD